MSRKLVQETIDRINDLMKRNALAETYLDLSAKDNEESMDLVGRIEEIAEAMTIYRRRNLSDKEKELYQFVETITESEIAFFKEYFAWFRNLSRKDSGNG